MCGDAAGRWLQEDDVVNALELLALVGKQLDASEQGWLLCECVLLRLKQLGDAASDKHVQKRLTGQQVESQRCLEDELRRLLTPESLLSPVSIPETVTRIFCVFADVVGWALVFSTLAQTFNSAEACGGETARRVLIYVWHEIMEVSMWQQLPEGSERHEVLDHAFGFVPEVQDTMAGTSTRERSLYSPLVDTWLRRGYLEQQQVEYIRAYWKV